MFTYLFHQPKELEPVRGILIYPFNGKEIDEVYRWNEWTTIEVRPVDLGAQWHDIYWELMQVINEEA